MAPSKTCFGKKVKRDISPNKVTDSLSYKQKFQIEKDDTEGKLNDDSKYSKSQGTNFTDKKNADAPRI